MRACYSAMERKFLILWGIFFFLAVHQLFSQTTIVLKGQLLDAETKAPLPYASVYLKNETIGTISNTEGHFVFHIPKEQYASTVVIAAMGYANQELIPSEYKDNTVIQMEPKHFELDEVQLSGAADKVLSAKEIVKRAYRKIPENYPAEPYILEGFVRDLQKEEDNYVEFLECAAKFKYKGTQVRQEPRIELLGVRTQGISQKHPWNKNSERKNSLIDLVEDDFIRFDYGPILGKKGWKYTVEEVVTYNGKLVYQIAAEDRPFQTATLFIDAKSFAFVKMELTRKAKGNRSWRRRFTNGALQVYYNVVFEYQEYQGKMFLKYQKEEDHWRIFKGLESNKVLFTKYPKKELFINRIITDDITNYPFQRNMDIGSSIENQADAFDKSFWATYNIPQRSSDQSLIIKELQGSN